MNFLFWAILFSYLSLSHGNDLNFKGCVMLNGQQYLERPYNMTEFFARPNDNIVLHFKTINPGGLFFYLKAGPAAYILLKLDHGKIVFEADFGAGNVSATVPSASLNDSKWHTVVVKRRGKNVNVFVDQFTPASVAIPMNLTQFRPNPSNSAMSTAMYIFGGPSDIGYPVHFTGIVMDRLSINAMQPIFSYYRREPEYSLHGSGNGLMKTYCDTDL